MSNWSRRSLIAAGAGLAVASHMPGAAAAATARPPGLASIARRKGRSFGLMINASDLADPALMGLVRREADMIVAGFAMKWRSTHAAAGRSDWNRADAVVDWATANAIRARGHAGFWYRSVPDWARPLMADARGGDAILAHISEIVGRYRGRLAEWDVLNEVLNPADKAAHGLRLAPFGRPPPLDLLADCFRVARAADPRARLYYNDFGMEENTPHAESKRAALLALVRRLRGLGAPIDGIGLQTHLVVGMRFDPAPYARFLAELAGLGLSVRLTELDVKSRALRLDRETFDTQIADCARRVLDVAFACPAVAGVIAWGVRPRDSWLNAPDRAAEVRFVRQRPLPFDDDLRPTPLWHALSAAFANAPARGT